MLPDFEMLLPTTLNDALKSMTTLHAVPVAGGTNVVVDLRSGRFTPDAIINIQNLEELSGIRIDDGYVTLGGGVTIAEIEKSPLIAQYGRCLQQSSLIFANPLIRNRATIGGNLADASPAADTATPLLALGASLVLSDAHGSRTVPLDEFFVHVRKTVLKPEELISEIRWSIPGENSTSSFYKLGLRKADAISVVSAAVMIETHNDTISLARIALGSVAPTPIRARDAEQVLMGQKPGENLILSAIHLAEKATSPISDVRASGSYRREMAGVLVGRLLRQAFADLGKMDR